MLKLDHPIVHECKIEVGHSHCKPRAQVHTHGYSGHKYQKLLRGPQFNVTSKLILGSLYAFNEGSTSNIRGIG